MSRRKTDPLRPLTDDEIALLTKLSRSQSESATRVARAGLILAVARGCDYQPAAESIGRRSGDAVSHLVARFNAEGLAALDPRHGGGRVSIYDGPTRERILQEARRQPTPEADGTASWSLTTLQKALRSAPDGLPMISTYTIWRVLHEAGASPQKTRSWCPTGTVLRKRKSGIVEVTDPDTTAKKLIEDAYQLGETPGISVWCTDQAGPFQTVPQPGASWETQGHPACQPHEYFRNGTAKIMTLFHPTDGEIRVKGVTACPNTVLHGWLKEELSAILAQLPPPPIIPGSTITMRSI